MSITYSNLNHPTNLSFLAMMINQRRKMIRLLLCIPNDLLETRLNGWAPNKANSNVPAERREVYYNCNAITHGFITYGLQTKGLYPCPRPEKLLMSVVALGNVLLELQSDCSARITAMNHHSGHTCTKQCGQIRLKNDIDRTFKSFKSNYERPF